MSKKILFLAASLLVMPACQKRASTVTVHSPKLYNTPVYEECVSTRPIFEGEVEGFVLEETRSAFDSKSDEGNEREIVLIENDSSEDNWFEKRLEAQQKYGFKTIYFDWDKYKIRADQKAITDHNFKKVIEAIRKGSIVVVEGHACPFAGCGRYNMMLSEKRAVSVADYLVEKGVPAAKIKVVGRGEEMPIVPDGDKEQQAPNRRVEIYVLE